MVVSSHDSSKQASPGRSGWLARVRGAMTLAAALCVGGIGWLVLNILAGNIRKSPDHADRISDFARGVIDSRAWLPLLTLPVAVAGMWLMANRKSPSGKRLGWVVAALCTLWLILVFALVLLTFVLFLAPLYRYESLG